jgi:AcrR family transcriptional regulator
VIEARRNVETLRPASPEETRERILCAAREVIAKKGKRGATTREIADVAGVNEATLFRHFGTKEALMVAVAQHFCPSGMLRGIAAELDGEIADDLVTLARFMREQMASQMDMIRWSLVEMEYEADIFASTAWRPQLAMLETMRDFMSRRVAKGELRGDPEKLAMVFMGLIFMHVLGSKKFPDSQLHSGSPDSALSFYVDIFLNGVRS